MPHMILRGAPRLLASAKHISVAAPNGASLSGVRRSTLHPRRVLASARFVANDAQGVAFEQHRDMPPSMGESWPSLPGLGETEFQTLEQSLLKDNFEDILEDSLEDVELNPEMWAGYKDLPSMATATDKHEILQLFDSFLLARRRHVYLFVCLKNAVLEDMNAWTAPELAVLFRTWAELSFLQEDALVRASSRIVETLHLCDARELSLLLDAYATARCSVSSIIDGVLLQTLHRLDSFSDEQLCLHASSLARLQVRGQGTEVVLEELGARLIRAFPEGGDYDEVSDTSAFSARNVAIAAHAMAELDACAPDAYAALERRALDVVKDFTPQDLSTLTNALARAERRDPALLVALSQQVHRRIAQFDAENVVLTLRALAFLGFPDQFVRGRLLTRVVAQLPRAIASFRPADLVVLLNTLAAARVRSPALFDVATPFIMERSVAFTADDWTAALRAYALLGERDELFLSAVEAHLRPDRLPLPALLGASLDIARLSSSSANLVGELEERHALPTAAAECWRATLRNASDAGCSYDEAFRAQSIESCLAAAREARNEPPKV
eukprot:TRINITY_DN20770_c0_g1_i1.p1 TRINITY_DN20770_c0_g1~~TRINITY_DN20770_c0_g1_i1.p1  ORF type:complete len:557 (+),score=111.27 TRINITY_DN20770_c0_g1_i1:105-1775(+)